MFDKRSDQHAQNDPDGNDKDLQNTYLDSFDLAERFDLGFIACSDQLAEQFGGACDVDTRPQRERCARLRNLLSGLIAEHASAPGAIRLRAGQQRMIKTDDGSLIFSVLFKLDDGNGHPAVFDQTHLYCLERGETRTVASFIAQAMPFDGPKPKLHLQNLYCPNAFLTEIASLQDPRRQQRVLAGAESLLYSVARDAVSAQLQKDGVVNRSDAKRALYEDAEALWWLEAINGRGYMACPLLDQVDLTVGSKLRDVVVTA